MTMVAYTTRRNVLADDAKGNEVRICLCFIKHENGYIQAHAIPEDFIKFAGEGVIEKEVQEAAMKGGIEWKAREATNASNS